LSLNELKDMLENAKSEYNRKLNNIIDLGKSKGYHFNGEEFRRKAREGDDERFEQRPLRRYYFDDDPA
jgi:hypothetical protein